MRWGRSLCIVVVAVAMAGASILVVGEVASGATTAAATRVVAATTVAQNDAFVTHVYQDLLGRAPDPAGLSYWSGVLGSGASRGAVAWALVTSDEHRADVINAMYQKFLRRSPDAGGLAYWVGRLAAGMTYAEVQVHLLGSDDYYKSQASSDLTMFIITAYEDVTGNSIDPATRDQYRTHLQQQPSPDREGFISDLMGQSGYSTKTADTYYQQFLGRAADPGGRAYWASKLVAPIRHAEEIVSSAFLYSDEYWIRVTS